MMSRPTCRPENETGGAQRFFYNNALGRFFLRSVLIRPWVSRLAGAYYSTRLSVMHVKPFIKSNGIDMGDYPAVKYRSFNDFFTRQVKEGFRPVDQSPQALIAPCDARLSVYNIDPDSIFYIKGGKYTVESLLGSAQLAQSFAGGLCMIFRLAVDNYHRYCYIDSGAQEPTVHIKGVFHTVHPIALGVSDIYKTNTREYTLLHTEHLGDVVQVEVGALMVGRIKNHRTDRASFKRGEEKGMFEFGGSTVVVILQKDKALPDEEFFANTRNGLETHVKMGERIGNILCAQ